MKLTKKRMRRDSDTFSVHRPSGRADEDPGKVERRIQQEANNGAKEVECPF